ncbi:MAG: hypothetical protein RL685_6405 [Pseudomonadota bacterium]|jgi:uncharacterized protein YyaL (SSP411 family)
MIGEINSDHGLPLRNGRSSSQQANGIQRPVSMQSNADVAGLASAALALASRLYRQFDATLASSYLQHAREIYPIAKANPRGSDPGLYGQTDPRYPPAWADEALCGAAELCRATGEQQYLTDALAYDEMVGSHQWAPNFSQSADSFRHSLIVRLRDEGNLAAAQPVAFKLETDIDNYGFVNNLPSQPHHRNQIATGNSLAGALVGGPTNGFVGPHQAGYQDNADDYLGNEVALDYNAGLVGLAAFGAAEARR